MARFVINHWFGEIQAQPNDRFTGLPLIIIMKEAIINKSTDLYHFHRPDVGQIGL